MRKYIPNILTFGRCVLTVIFLVMILHSPSARNKSLTLDIAFVIFVIAGVTDIIDGAVARKLGVDSKFGRMLDPLADKILVCGSFICFAVIKEPKLFDLSPVANSVILWSVVGIIVLREVYVTTIRHIAEAKGINFAATSSGKIKMFIQAFAIGTVIIKTAHLPNAGWGYWFTAIVLAIMLVVTVFSGIRATKRIEDW